MPLPTADALRTALEPHISAARTPGLVALAAQGDDARVVALGAMADDGERPMRRDAIFRIASMTKPVTAVASVDAGRGRQAGARRTGRPAAAGAGQPPRAPPPRRALDDTVPANRPITVEDLLTFRWGSASSSARRTHIRSCADGRAQPGGLRPAEARPCIRPRRVDAPAGRAAADGAARRGLALQRRLEHPGRADRARLRPVAR